MITLKLSEELKNKINNGGLQARDVVKFVLENTSLHFRLIDIKARQLTKENVYNELSLDKIYNDENEHIRKASVDLINNIITLNF